MKLHRGYCVASTLMLLLLSSLPVQADWLDWWKNAEQQAEDAYEAGDSDTLLELAPNDLWRGLGEHQAGDYQAASRSFGKAAEQLRADGARDAARTALYNQGVSDVLSGQYQQAIDRFDQLLAEEPADVDAQTNRQIAQQLLELEQRQQEQGDGSRDADQGEESQDGQSGGEQEGESDSAQGADQPDEQSGGEQSGNQGESGNDSQANSSSGSEGGSQSQDDTADSQPESEEQQRQEAQAAREALDAEAERSQQQDERSGSEDTDSVGRELNQPLSETEQALEQQLRRIPDDPAGLLRRKLEQSHRIEFPEVGDAIEPW